MQANQQELYSAMVNWLTAAGGTINSIELRVDKLNQRSLFSQADLAAKEQLLHIPETHLLSFQKAQQSAIGQQIEQAKSQFPEIITITCFILVENQNNESFWQPYFNMLPESFYDHPLFLLDTLNPYLENTEASNQSHSIFAESNATMMQLLTNRMATFKRIHRLLQNQVELFDYSFKQFLWSILCVTTRAFTLRMNNTSQASLIPMLDLLNHTDSKKLIYGFDDSSKAFKSVTTDHITQGQELLHSYSETSPTLLCIQYGIVQDIQNLPMEQRSAPFYLYIDPTLFESKNISLDSCDNTDTFFDLSLEFSQNEINFLNRARALEYLSQKTQDENIGDFKFTLEFEQKVIVSLIASFENQKLSLKKSIDVLHKVITEDALDQQPLILLNNEHYIIEQYLIFFSLILKQITQQSAVEPKSMAPSIKNLLIGYNEQFFTHLIDLAAATPDAQ